MHEFRTFGRQEKRLDAVTVPYTDKAFLPYVRALGQLALAWNGLHESMAILFCTIMGGGFVGRFLAVWHAIKNDRVQRGILLAAVRTNSAPPLTGFSGESGERLISDIEWLCNRADEVEEARNNALHSPLWGYQRGPSSLLKNPSP